MRRSKLSGYSYGGPLGAKPGRADRRRTFACQWLLALAMGWLLIAAPGAAADRAYDILPPGQFGGVPFTAHSTDQIPLYDGLTPLRRSVTAADIVRFYKPETLQPAGPTTVEPTGRAGLKLVRDSFGVPYVTGRTRDDVWWGAGFVSGEDRALLLSAGRAPARAAVADIPGINAFGLVTSGQKFVPSAQDEQLLHSEEAQLVRAYGRKGHQILHDLAVYAQGVTAGLRKAGNMTITWTVDDAIATDAFIGSIFGNGGGN